MQVRYPIGQAALFNNLEIFVPQENCRSIIFSNTANANDAKVNGLTIPSGQAFTIDVYPGEVIAGQWKITTTGGEQLEILQLA